MCSDKTSKKNVTFLRFGVCYYLNSQNRRDTAMRINKMPTRHPLLDVTEIDTDIEIYLEQIGEITYRFLVYNSWQQSFQTVINNQRP